MKPAYFTEFNFPPGQTIFSCNVLSVVTGSPEHDGYAVDFIEAIAEVEAKIPGVFAGATLAPREQVQLRTVCGAS